MQNGDQPPISKDSMNAGPVAAWQQPVGKDGVVVCLLCPHGCRLQVGESGICRVRQNVDGTLIAWTYRRVATTALDPIEKKPLFRFMPGTRTYSVGYYGCNLRCDFCQNTHLSMADLKPGDPIAEMRHRSAAEMEPQEIVEEARRAGAPSISYTYNEPLIAYESVLETAKHAHQAGLKNILVTNGFINRRPMEELLPFIDAMNIDLKDFDEKRYQSWCGGRLQPVLDTIERCIRTCHVEVTMLVVTGMNDSVEAMRPAFSWLGQLDIDIPLHITRYFPANRWHKPSPAVSLLEQLREEASAHLRYVYVGNV